MRKISITKKIVFLIIVLLLTTSATIIYINRSFYQSDMRQQLQAVQLPLVSDKVLSEIDKTIMESGRGVMLLVNNPFFHQWLRGGMDEAYLETVFTMLDSMRTNYDLLSVNFASADSLEYYAFSADGHATMAMETTWPPRIGLGSPSSATAAYPRSPTSTSTTRLGRRLPTPTTASISMASSKGWLFP